MEVEPAIWLAGAQAVGLIAVPIVLARMNNGHVLDVQKQAAEAERQRLKEAADEEQAFARETQEEERRRRRAQLILERREPAYRQVLMGLERIREAFTTGGSGDDFLGEIKEWKVALTLQASQDVRDAYNAFVAGWAGLSRPLMASKASVAVVYQEKMGPLEADVRQAMRRDLESLFADS